MVAPGKQSALQVFQIGRGLMQGMRGFHDSGKAAGKTVVRTSFRKSRSTGIIRKLLPSCHLLPSLLPVKQREDSQTTHPKAVGKIPSQPSHLLLPTLPITASRRGFPGGSGGKESACSAGDLGWEDSLEEGMATPSTIVA